MFRGDFNNPWFALSVISENGPKFRSDVFGRYLEDCGVEHRKTTPFPPQANGEVDRQNSSLLKPRRSSRHTTTGVSPAERFFGKQMLIKPPELREEVIATGMRDRDSGKKTKAKMYAENKRNTKPSDVSPGHKQERQNKLSTPCAPEPHEVVTKTGNSVVIEYPESVQLKRNTIHVNKYEE